MDLARVPSANEGWGAPAGCGDAATAVQVRWKGGASGAVRRGRGVYPDFDKNVGQVVAVDDLAVLADVVVDAVHTLVPNSTKRACRARQ